LLDDAISVTHRKSRHFNFSPHAKINHIEFEDKFLIKTHANVKYFLPEDCWRNFLTSWERNEWNTERLSAKVWNSRFNRTHCSKRSAVLLQF